MNEMQDSHKITINIIKEIPTDKSVTLYQLRSKTKNSIITLKYHIAFLEKLSIIKVNKKYTGKKIAYEIKLTKIGTAIQKNIVIK